MGRCHDPGDFIANGSVTFNDTMQEDIYFEGTVITVGCEKGYQVSDGGRSECLRNGLWSAESEIPTCTSEWMGQIHLG